VALLWLAFFLSGIAGLSYELTWLRYLTQLFGASTPAVSATVSIFFTGLAVGSAVGSRFFSKRKNPARAYALLEISIGVVAALIPILFGLAEKFMVNMIRPGGENVLTLMLLATVLLFLPTCLLGATFPAMAAVVETRHNTTQSTGFFYGLNTLGAVLGCMMASFWALPALGQGGTTWLMASINLFVGALVWFGAGSTAKADASESSAADAPATAEVEREPVVLQARHPLSSNMAVAVAVLSGFCAIGIEVLWSRALALSVSGSVFVFALILASYLSGIGFGSLWIGVQHSKKPPEREFLSLLYMVVALGTLLTIFFFPTLLTSSIGLLNKKFLTSYSSYLFWVGGSAVIMMLPATVAMGAALPLLIGLATRSDDRATAVSGRLYGLNTVGGVFGSLLATYFLMPRIGLTNSLVLLALIYLLLAGVVLKGVFKELSKLFIYASLGIVVVFFFLMGRYNDINPLKFRRGQKLIYYKDSSSATIAIYQNRKGERVLRNNNYYGLSRTNPKTLRMQYRLGLIPTLLHPKPKNTLLIGFATGTTLSAMASVPTIKQAECVELHGIIPKLAHYFAKANHAIWKHPRVKIKVADGRRYLLRKGKAYDVIVGDLYLPKNPGVGALYSVEHFRAVRSRLSKDGLFVAWLPAFQMGPKEMSSIIHTFLQVFPNAEGWLSQWSPSRPIIGLVGTRNDKAPSVRKGFTRELRTRVHALMNPRRYRKIIADWKLQASSQPSSKPAKPAFPSLRLLTNAHLKVWGKGAPLNRLQRPLIEFWAPKSIMEARMNRFPLAFQNIAKIGSIRSLKSTPWHKTWLFLSRRYKKK
jgi:spermidine synthase